MKLFQNNHVFNYKWEQVTAANWQKYPNELSQHVVSVDVLDRHFDSQRGVLRTERLILCKQSVPKWVRFLIGGQKCSYVREISEVDLKNKIMVMKSHNLTMTNLLLVKETIIYKPDKDLPSTRSFFKQVAEITAFSPFSKLCEKIENWSVELFVKNSVKGMMAFESLLNVLAKKWEDSNVFVAGVGNTL